MNAFERMTASVFADTNHTLPADYRRAGQGPASRVRVIRSVLEPEAAPLGLNLKARADTLSVRTADCPALARDDTFTLDPDAAPTLLTVLDAMLDAEGLSFLATVRRS